MPVQPILGSQPIIKGKSRQISFTPVIAGATYTSSAPASVAVDSTGRLTVPAGAADPAPGQFVQVVIVVMNGFQTLGVVPVVLLPSSTDLTTLLNPNGSLKSGIAAVTVGPPVVPAVPSLRAQPSQFAGHPSFLVFDWAGLDVTTPLSNGEAPDSVRIVPAGANPSVAANVVIDSFIGQGNPVGGSQISNLDALKLANWFPNGAPYFFDLYVGAGVRGIQPTLAWEPGAQARSTVAFVPMWATLTVDESVPGTVTVSWSGLDVTVANISGRAPDTLAVVDPSTAIEGFPAYTRSYGSPVPATASGSISFNSHVAQGEVPGRMPVALVGHSSLASAFGSPLAEGICTLLA
jgi:hypothetical protein